MTRLATSLLAVALLLASVWWVLQPAPTVVVGVLHSFQGDLAESEQPVALATEFAVAQLNAAGGVLGHQVVVERGQGDSDDARFAAEATRLLDDRGVRALFGCWTSSSRRTVEPVLRERGALLYYPVFYEGLEQSEHIVYLGASASQRIAPAAQWARMVFGPRVALVGSDYVFPAAAHELIRHELARTRADVIAEAFIPLRSSSVSAELVAGRVADAVAALAAVSPPPDAVINTINGEATEAFLGALRAVPALADVPVLSFAVSEAQLDRWPPVARRHHYVASSYLSSQELPANDRFLRDWHRAHPTVAVSEAMVRGYTAAKLWAAAVEIAGTFDPVAVREATLGLSISAPGGTEFIDPEHAHVWRDLAIARADETGQLNELFRLPAPRAPDVWPVLGRDAWEAWLRRLRDERYDGGWSAK